MFVVTKMINAMTCWVHTTLLCVTSKKDGVVTGQHKFIHLQKAWLYFTLGLQLVVASLEMI